MEAPTPPAPHFKGRSVLTGTTFLDIEQDVLPTALSSDDIKRRVEFVLQEARLLRCNRDQAVTFSLRVISNFLSIQRDGASPLVKRHCRFRSAAAVEVCQGHWKTWHKLVTNEHQEPLARLWKWIKERADSLTAKEVLERMAHWPVVVVTTEENKLLRGKKMDQREPDDRYRQANIQVMMLAEDGRWIPRGY